MTNLQPLPDACNPDLGHLVARANQAGSNGCPTMRSCSGLS
jgi:hypothetical protein